MDSPQSGPRFDSYTLNTVIPLSALSVKCCAMLFSQNEKSIIALRANKTYTTAAAPRCNIDLTVAAFQEDLPGKLCSVRFPTLFYNYFFPIKFKISSIFSELRRHLRAIFPLETVIWSRKITLPVEKKMENTYEMRFRLSYWFIAARQSL